VVAPVLVGDLQVLALLYVVVCVAPLCLVVDTAAFLLSKGRVSVLAYLGLCLFPLLGLVVVPLLNVRATRRRPPGDAIGVHALSRSTRFKNRQ